MGKKFYYITSEGKEVAKADFDASNGAKVEVNPKAGSWELIMTCIPTEEMLDAVESRLASWLKTRRNMAAPFEEGSRVRIDGAQPDSFKLNLPQSSISKKQTEEIGQAWFDWKEKFNTSAPQTTQQQSQQQTPQQQTPQQQSQQQTPQQQSQQQTPQQQPAARTKKFWEMTDEERIAHNEERMNFYLNRANPQNS